MKIWKVILATLVIFAAGAMTGGLLVKNNQPPAPVTPAPAGPPSPMIVQDRFLERMKRDLNLTPEQTAKLGRIFAESRERMKILMDLIEPETRAELAEVREKVKAELRPDQRERFEQLMRHQFRPGEMGDGPRMRSPYGGDRRGPDRDRDRDRDRGDRGNRPPSRPPVSEPDAP